MKPKGKNPHDKYIAQYNLIESGTTITKCMKTNKRFGKAYLHKGKFPLFCHRY